MPILACAMHAEDGALRSGVEVATMIKSISFGSSSAEAIAFRPAQVARSDVYSSGSAMCRSRIPKVSTIHSGEVGKSPTNSSFVTTLAGTYEPVDLMRTLSKWLFRLVILSPILQSNSGQLAKADFGEKGTASGETGKWDFIPRPSGKWRRNGLVLQRP